MSEKMQETITDTIAEMRRRKEMLEDAIFNAPLCYSTETMQAQREILDEFIESLEAAHKREVDKTNSVIQATVSHSNAEIDRLQRELSKTRPKNGGYFGQFDAAALRNALKDIEATVTAALAHQPEDEAKCGQFLYDALVKCFNIADLACNAARTESGAAVSREAATAENSSAVGNTAKLREALKLCGSRMCRLCKELELARSMLNKRTLGVFCHSDKCEAFQAAHAALALPLRQCDVGTAEEQAERFYEFCMANSSAIQGLCDSECPCIDSGDKCHCLTRWAQLPHESEAAK